MKSLLRFAGLSLAEAAWGGGVLICSVLVMQFVVDPKLIYQNLMPLFYWGSPFIGDAARHPGGLLDYASRFLQQGYCTNLGSIIMALLVGLTWILSRQISIARFANDPDPDRTTTLVGTLSRILPACVLLFLSARYDFSWMTTALQVVVSMLASAGFVRYAGRNAAIDLILFCMISAALNQVGGLVPAALFTLVVAGSEITRSARRIRGVLLLVAGAVISAVFISTFPDFTNALLPSPVPVKRIVLTLYGLIVALPFVPQFKVRQVQAPEEVNVEPARRRRGEKPEAAAVVKPSNPALPGVIVSWAVLALAVVMAVSMIDTKERNRLSISCHADRQEWDQVLAAAHQVETRDWSVRMHTMRALYHKGRLLDELFDFPFMKGEGVVPSSYGEALHSAPTLAQMLLELGQVNMAEHWAHEALELMGERPDLLKIITKINVLKNRPQAAVAFLGYLRKNPLYQDWADDYLQRLRKDPKLDSDPEIAYLRSVKVTTDFMSMSPANIVFLQQLLHSNPANRMAFDYLMAEYLLELKSQQVVQNTKSFDPAKDLPRLVQEAIADYQLQEQKPIPQMERIRKETGQQLTLFCEAVSLYKSDPEKGRDAMVQNFGNTYWYYNMYGGTGAFTALNRSK